MGIKANSRLYARLIYLEEVPAFFSGMALAGWVSTGAATGVTAEEAFLAGAATTLFGSTVAAFSTEMTFACRDSSGAAFRSTIETELTYDYTYSQLPPVDYWTQ
jgi:hypothetical protein